MPKILSILHIVILIFFIPGCLSVKKGQQPIGSKNAPASKPISRSTGDLPGNKHALLIGIENYRPPISPLKGAINDVELTKGVLRTQFGFQDQDLSF